MSRVVSRLAGGGFDEPDWRIRSHGRSRPRSRGSTHACRSTAASTFPGRARSSSRRSIARTSTRRSRVASRDVGCATWARTPCGTTGRSAGCCRRSAGSPSPAGRPTGRPCGVASKCSGWARCSCCTRRASARTDRSCSRCSTGRPTSPPRPGVPIVPVGIGGSDRVMPTRRTLRLSRTRCTW